MKITDTLYFTRYTTLPDCGAGHTRAGQTPSRTGSSLTPRFPLQIRTVTEKNRYWIRIQILPVTTDM